MKKFLFTLVGILFTGVCFAQDIIVQKDGSTIQAKILKVDKTKVEYKRFDNQNGPTYTIETKDLQVINYQNGTKDTFVSPNYDPSIVTNENATQYSKDKDLLTLYDNLKKNVMAPDMMYKKGKRMKVAGFVVGGTLLVGGLVSVIIGATQDKYVYENLYAEHNIIYLDGYSKYKDERAIYFYVGYGLMAGGVAVGIPLVLKGNSLIRKSREHVQAQSVISKDINFGNGSTLNLGIDAMSTNSSYIITPGIGIRYNF